VIFEAERLVQIDWEDLRQKTDPTTVFFKSSGDSRKLGEAGRHTRRDKKTQATGVDRVMWSRRAIWETPLSRTVADEDRDFTN
jgi:hypothetical protein